jgi:hypothetical protein
VFNSALTSLFLVLLLLIGSAQLLGALFVRLRQPKVIGEILAAVAPPRRTYQVEPSTRGTRMSINSKRTQRLVRLLRYASTIRNGVGTQRRGI